MKTTVSMYERAYRLGQRHAGTGDMRYWYTRSIDKAYLMGYEGHEIDFTDIVSGYRYGDIPEGGVSFNYLDDMFEKGLSLAAVDGEKEVGSSMWFYDREKVKVSGIRLPFKGSDGETLILPLGIEQYDFEE